MSPSTYFLSTLDSGPSSDSVRRRGIHGHQRPGYPRRHSAVSCRLTGPLACCCSCARVHRHTFTNALTTIKPMNWNRIGRRTSNVTLGCINYHSSKPILVDPRQRFPLH
ncbi:hypothetical protein CISG_05176 [Coccidioides immitis RMSCC 3703]|uniref:Uncharacterized protein n=1 Tax=Coccidioides immitis RMSCC 3703 TaxID=454286 RepID=A0A0J8QSK3_COCIT|nr:hypothetical protein CISG_05176 [Coccidioides immitis RMSCC 3703]